MRKGGKIAVLAAGLAWAVTTFADGPGHSFITLESPYTQELYGVTASPVDSGLMGGVAFSPDGDVLGGECFGSQYHRFDRQTPVPDGHGGTVRQESLVDLSTYAPSPVGCGLVNHPQLYMGLNTIFANTTTGLWPVDADTGLPILGGPLNSAISNAGNGRGIDVDPVAQPTNHIVYVGMDCDPTMSASPTCTLWNYNLTMSNTRAFARFSRGATESFESLYFMPDGSHAFVSYRDTATGTQGLAVVARPAALLERWEVDDSQVIGRIAMSSMPQGIAFRSAGDFAVTLNEDGTMTKLVFPGLNFTGTPTQSTFADGGFLGGLLRVGADGCIYAPHGRKPGDVSGIRYADNALGTSDGVTRVCGGFAAAPGVAGATWSPEPGSISGSAFADWNRNGVKDSVEPGLSGLSISLSGAGTATTSTSAGGAYSFANVAAGLYSVSAPANINGLTTNPTPLAVNVGSGENKTGVDFAYSETTPPVCTVAVQQVAHAKANFTLRDDSGVRRVRVRSLSNFQVAIAGGAPVSSPTTVDFGTPVQGNVSVVATRTVDTANASVELEVEDAFGTLTTCSSTIPGTPGSSDTPTTPADGHVIREEVTAFGRDHINIDRVASTMRYITVRNGRNGLQTVDVYVNRHLYRLSRLRNSETRAIDVKNALIAGKKNVIVLIGWGHFRESAVVTISDRK
jgi:hypothetical protein